MEKIIGNSIQVTRGLEGVLESLGMKMYEEWVGGVGRRSRSFRDGWRGQ